VLSALFMHSLKMRCACHFILNEASGTAPSRCIDAARAPLERALDPGRPRPRRGPRESWSRGRGVVASGKWQAAGAISVVGKTVLTLYPPLRPLSHNVNPRDGAQDMTKDKLHNAQQPDVPQISARARATGHNCPTRASEK
jgi:hypothetical protein